MAFRYWVIYEDERRQTPRNVFVINRDDHRLDTVSWSYLDRAWRHDRSVLGYLVSGDRNDANETTREHAEEVAGIWAFSRYRASRRSCESQMRQDPRVLSHGRCCALAGVRCATTIASPGEN